MNTVIALDETTHRMFVACYEGQLVVMDLNNGKELQTLPIGMGADDISFDTVTKRIYVSGGAGKGQSMFTKRKTPIIINPWAESLRHQELLPVAWFRSWENMSPLSQDGRLSRRRFWCFL